MSDEKLACEACNGTGEVLIFGERLPCIEQGCPTLTRKVVKVQRDYDNKKATRGMSIVHAESRYRNSNNDLGSVLLDLMHFAAQFGKDFDKEVEWARKAMREDLEQK